MLRKNLLMVVLLAVAVAGSAQDKSVKKLIELGKSDNQVMAYEDFLSNRIGGRLIGSHALEDAEKWVVEQFESMGLEVMVQEVGQINVGFNRGPWSGRMIGDGGCPLKFITPSYTSGTKGPQKGHVVIEPKTEEQFNRIKGKLKGAWVLVDARTGGFAINPTDTSKVRFYKEMEAAGALGFIQSSTLPLTALYDRANCYNITMETLPSICDIHLDNEQYDMIRRKVERKEDIQLEFDIRNHFNRGPVKYHNIIGIMRGSKYPDQYVLTGGHLDAYDAATGSVDDANGVCITLATARILAECGFKPKRTIMFCIWTGEEFGLLGSKYFVEHKTVPLEKISNYINRDGGPLCAMGVTVPPAMKEDYEKICQPLFDLNPDFPFTVNVRTDDPKPRPKKGGGSDHAYFAMNGVPTVSFMERDPKGYGFEYREIWHTDKDLYNKLIPEYLEHSVIVHAVTIYGLSNLDHILSREGLYKD